MVGGDQPVQQLRHLQRETIKNDSFDPSFGDRGHGKDLVAGLRGVSTEDAKTSEAGSGGEGFLSCRPTDDGGRQSELWDSEGWAVPQGS